MLDAMHARCGKYGWAQVLVDLGNGPARNHGHRTAISLQERLEGSRYGRVNSDRLGPSRDLGQRAVEIEEKRAITLHRRQAEHVPTIAEINGPVANTGARSLIDRTSARALSHLFRLFGRGR